MMNNNDKVVMYGWVSAILAIALVVGAIVWITTSRNSLENKTVEFQQDLSYYKSEIQKICTSTPTTTPAARAECDGVLEEFSDMLREYRDTLEEYPASTTVPTVGTTTTGSSTGTSTN